MSITCFCPECFKQIRVNDRAAGKTIRCPDCQGKISIPRESDKENEEFEIIEPPAPIADKPRRKIKKRRPKSLAETPSRWNKSGRSGQGTAIVILLMLVSVTIRVGRAILRNSMDQQAVVAQQEENSRPQSRMSTIQTASATLPNQISAIPIPVFPELGPEVPMGSSGVVMHSITLSGVAGNSAHTPGSRMRLLVFRPRGREVPRSLNCVLIAPAGTPLFHGINIDQANDSPEAIPYAEAGMVSVMYSLDGAVSGTGSNREYQEGYHAFSSASAGLVNGRNAIEFVLQKLPYVNPDRIYCAGHSSAGTLSLLFAAHERRLHGAIAYAPCVNVPRFLKANPNWRTVKQLLPDVENFATWSSPHRYIERMHMPVFLFQSRTDSVIPYAETSEFASQIVRMNERTKLQVIPGGDHHDSMLTDGIPAGIRWIQQQN